MSPCDTHPSPVVDIAIWRSDIRLSQLLHSVLVRWPPSCRAAFGIQKSVSSRSRLGSWRGLIWPISSSRLQTLGRRLAIQDPGFTSLRFFGTTELRRGLSNEQVQFAKCPSGIERAECRPPGCPEPADILRGKVPACPQLRRIAVECYRKSRREAAMTGQIKRSIGSITIVTMLLVSFVGITALANTARADDCIAAPNSPSPPGKHWYYRLDWATKRKCWYVGPLGRSVQEAAPSATKGRATHLRSVPGRSNQQLQADDPPLSPGEAGPSSSPLKAVAVKPNAASVSATADEATSSFPEISAPQASTFSETVAKGPAPGSSTGPASSATTDDAALSTPKASPPQASALSETGPTFGVGELTDNAWLPMISLLYVALGLAVVGILSFAVLKLFKNETNKMLAGADVTEVAALVAASMDLSLGRGCDSNGESGNLQQADAFVLKEPGCARDSEEPDEGTAPTLHRDSNGELASRTCARAWSNDCELSTIKSAPICSKRTRSY